MSQALRASPLTVRLALFAVVSSLALNLLLAGLGEPTTFVSLGHFATATQGVDSWRPMNQAHAYLATGAERPLYDWLFFERRVKFIYPPTALLLLDLLPDDALRRALNLLSWLLVFATAIFASAILDRGLQASRFVVTSAADRIARVVIAVALSLTFYPVLKAYSLGQMQVWVNAFFAAAVWCWLVGRKATAGVLVVLMAAVKPQYGVVALWGVLRGERRFVLAAAISGATLLGVSLLRFGWEHHVDYLSVVSHVSRLGEAYWPNQTPNGFLHRLLSNGVSAHWDPQVYPPYHAGVYVGTLAASATLLLVALFWRSASRGQGSALDFGAMALAATIASPIAWEHHYGVLLPLFALLLPALLETPRALRVLLLLAVGYGVAANYLDALSRLTGTAWNPLQSLLLFVALGVLALLLRLRSVELALLLPFPPSSRCCSPSAPSSDPDRPSVIASDARLTTERSMSQPPAEGVLRGSHVLEYSYRRSLGPVLGRFFNDLRARKLVGIRTRSGKVLVPPQEYDPDTGESLDEIVDVGPGGEIVSWAWVTKPRRKQPLQHPFAYALIKLDGADTGMLHAVDAGDESKLSVGARVVPRWAAEPSGSICDIECFELEGTS